MKRINKNMIRRDMKQLKIYIDHDVAEAYKQLCKDKGSSVNIELEKYITHKVKKWKKTRLQKPVRKMSYKESVEAIKSMDEWKEVSKAFGYPDYSKVSKNINTTK